MVFNFNSIHIDWRLSKVLQMKNFIPSLEYQNLF